MSTDESLTVETKPWHKMKDESSLWHDRFRRFWRMGAKRSILAVYNSERTEAGKGKRKTIPGAWLKAAQTWDWRGRAEAWDADMRQRQNRLWLRRQLELRQSEWTLSENILSEVAKMTSSEQGAAGNESGNETATGNTDSPSISLRDRAYYLKTLVTTGSQLGRLATGLPTENKREELTGAGGGPIDIVHDIEAIRRKRWRDVAEKLEAASREETEGMQGQAIPPSP